MKKIISSLIIAVAVLSANAAGQIKWHSADSLPLIGKAVDDASTSNRYQRIPDSLLHTVRNGALAGLGRNSAGMALRFAAKTGRVDVKWHSPFKTLMNHQTPTGSRGLDLYTLMPDGTWTFVNSARPNVNSHDSQANVISNMTPVMREYLLYLPLYDGVDSLYIGLDEDALLLQPSDVFHADKPIIMYGTSILQGG
ncbi:MAG: hydrolase, partial [Muribaculaceae bacterium]|nr:hydrolase [Muribaculaceae bacterium]